MAVSLEDIRQPTAPGENVTYDYELLQTMGLSQLDLSNNRLNGTIPTTIGELLNLQAVEAFLNQAVQYMSLLMRTQHFGPIKDGGNWDDEAERQVVRTLYFALGGDCVRGSCPPPCAAPGVVYAWG